MSVFQFDLHFVYHSFSDNQMGEILHSSSTSHLMLNDIYMQHSIVRVRFRLLHDLHAMVGPLRTVMNTFSVLQAMRKNLCNFTAEMGQLCHLLRRQEPP